MKKIDLGINIDHIATLRNARAEKDPSLLEMAFCVQDGGADTITMHLREDRRHIKDDDIFSIKEHCKLPINLEMALTKEMLDIALKLHPKSVCIVPEKREELTTEGGLNVKSNLKNLHEFIPLLIKNEIEVYLFVEADINILKLCGDLKASGVEVHTGTYAQNINNNIKRNFEIEKIKKAAEYCHENNLIFHAGHGLNYQNIEPLISIENLTEVNIGHSIIARSLKTGLTSAVREMKNIIEKHRGIL
ncbi:MAG: pyridoxine 5'-phosphate synthase [Spirochaetia bacterium]|nr:pyridoxine 5'-phosphate synthase [Spirochaetia bacterium]